MPYRSTYVCGECGYRRDVSGDRRWNSTTQITTISCSECRELYDAILQRYDQNRSMWIEMTPRCPVDSAHPVREWQLFEKRNQGVCPRCSATMHKCHAADPVPA